MYDNGLYKDIIDSSPKRRYICNHVDFFFCLKEGKIYSIDY